MSAEDAAPSSHLDEALGAFDEALQLIDKDAQPAWYGVVLHDIAQTYQVAERFDTAVEFYRESAVFKRHGGNQADISTTLAAQAGCLISSGRLDEAFGTLGEAKEALDLGAPGLDAGELMLGLHEIGRLYERLGSRGVAPAYDEAITSYRRALEVTDRETDPKSYAYVVRDLGDVYRATGRLRESVSAFSEAVSLLRGTDEQAYLAGILVDLGRSNRRLAEQDGERFLDDADTPRRVDRDGAGRDGDGPAEEQGAEEEQETASSAAE